MYRRRKAEGKGISKVYISTYIDLGIQYHLPIPFKSENLALSPDAQQVLTGRPIWYIDLSAYIPLICLSYLDV